MALNIKDAQAEALVRELAQITGETIAEAVALAAGERPERLRAGCSSRSLAAAVATEA